MGHSFICRSLVAVLGVCRWEVRDVSVVKGSRILGEDLTLDTWARDLMMALPLLEQNEL